MNKSRLLLVSMLSLVGCSGQKTLAPMDAVGDSSKGVSASTQAPNTLSLRVEVDQNDKKVRTLTPSSAQVGTFALTPTIQNAEGEYWRVEALDASGRVLHKVMVRSHFKNHIETFNPDTGAVEESLTVDEPSDVFEVSLPFGADVASINIELEGAPAALHETTPPASGRFTREALTQLVEKSQQSVRATANAVRTATLIDNGPSANKMDYVFIGDGYTAAEMDKWHADAKKVMDGFLADPLFAANRSILNVHRVDVVSAESGVDEPDRNIFRKTVMDATFNCRNIARLLCVDAKKARDIASFALAPDARDVIVVVANSKRYGGGGGPIASLSMAKESVELVLHEIGHTAFGMADEYDGGSCDLGKEPTGGNASKNGSRSVKWGKFIAANTPVPTQPGKVSNGTVGVFQGSDYCPTGKFRPTENSRMRNLGQPWHRVNEAIAGSVFAKYRGANTTNGETLLSQQE